MAFRKFRTCSVIRRGATGLAGADVKLTRVQQAREREAVSISDISDRIATEFEKESLVATLTRVRTHYSHQMTAAARAIAAMKFLMLRSKRVAIRRQSLRRQNMRSMMLRCL